jgi:hypothetical protein
VNQRVAADIRVRVERLASSGDERRTFELVGLRILGLATYSIRHPVRSDPDG